MKTLTTLFALAILSATASAQTIKALGYNTTNGEVAYSGTNVLTFTSATIFDVITFLNDANPSETFTLETEFEDQGSGEETLTLTHAIAGIVVGFSPNVVTFAKPLFFGEATNAAITRTNLGLGGGVITNIDVLVSGGGTNTLQFSNGILTNVTTP
jgi:hypothetical protein